MVRRAKTPKLPGKWDYPATVIRVVDGDTVYLHVTKDLDFGFNVTITAHAPQEFRLARCNAADKDKPEAMAAATKFTTQWLADHENNLRVTSLRNDNFGGRWDGEVYSADTMETLSDALLDSGHAVPWPKPRRSARVRA